MAVVNVQAIARGWINHYSLDLATTWYDVLAEYLVGSFFAHRAFPTLAFLLGVGLSYQWRSLTAESVAGAAHALSTMRARYVALLLLGVAHGLLLWPGDIVSSYAVVALVLLWKRPISERWLRRWIFVFGGLLAFMYALYAAVVWSSHEVPEASGVAPSFANAVWSGAFALHPSEYLTFGVIQATLPEVWLAILIGVWLGQTGRFDPWLSDPSRQSRGWFAIGLTSFLIGTVLELVASRLDGCNYDYGAGPGRALFVLGVPFAAAGSVFVVLSIARAWSPATLPALRSLFISAGRAPLTIFFGMSLIMVPVFHESFIGWHDDLGRASYSAIAIATFFSLAAFSRAWLRAGHARGPFEWVWLRVASWFTAAGR